MDDANRGRGSYNLVPKWRKELHTKATMLEVTTHESYSSKSFGPVRWRQRKCWTCALVIEATAGLEVSRGNKVPRVYRSRRGTITVYCAQLVQLNQLSYCSSELELTIWVNCSPKVPNAWAQASAQAVLR